jgi:hypothetical protein
MRRALTLAVALLAGACGPKHSLTAAVRQFEAQTGVDVHVTGTLGEPLPPVPSAVELGVVDPKLARQKLPLLSAVLMAYPSSVRRDMIGHLYLVGKLRIDGVPFLGVAQPRQGRFELALRPQTDPEELARTMHHEIGHLFEAEDPYRTSGFRDVSADAYVGQAPVKHWKDAARLEWLTAGFVTPYASKNAAEDFSEIAGLAWMHPDRARELAKRFPTIGAKLDMLTDIYQRTAPGIVLPWTGAGWSTWLQEHGADAVEPAS